MKAMNDYVAQKQLEKTLDEAFKKNNRLIVDEISETMGSMMDRMDERFNGVEQRLFSVENRLEKVENEIVDLKASHDRLLNTIDGFVKRLEEYEVESRVRDVQFERLVKWAEEVSEKTGIALPQL